jgi:hypothetical protein
VLGAAIALGGERFLTSRAERERFRAHISTLQAELEKIGQESEERLVTVEPIRQQAPLPTGAWKAFLASGLGDRLSANEPIENARAISLSASTT